MEQQIYSYPAVKRDDNYRDKFNLPDPYHWLEDPDSEETKNFIQNQNKLTDQYFSDNHELYSQILQKLNTLNTYQKYSTPQRHRDFIYFCKNDGLQNHDVIYRQAMPSLSSLANKGKDMHVVLDENLIETFMDPNSLSKDGTISVSYWQLSHTKKYFLYLLSQNDSDWCTVKVKHTDSKQDLTDELAWVKLKKFAWLHNDSGFFYTKFPQPNDQTNAGIQTNCSRDRKIYFHHIGDKQENDTLIYELPEEEKDFYISVQVTYCGKYLLLYKYQGCQSQHKLYYAPIQAQQQYIFGNDIQQSQLQQTQIQPSYEFVKFLDRFEIKCRYITNDNDMFYFFTDFHAPKNRIVCLQLTQHLDTAQFEEIVPEPQEKGRVLNSCRILANDKLLLFYTHNVCESIQVRSLYDKNYFMQIDAPAFGTLQAMSVNREEMGFFYKYVSFLHPGTILYFSFESNKSTVFKQIQLNSSTFDASNYSLEQLWYTSNDGTEIPMFLIQKKCCSQNNMQGNIQIAQPCYLYGYGGFSTTIGPSFNVSRIVLLDNLNVSFAIANIRGGDEFGEEWHLAGIREKKQNGFDDFHCAAKYLIQKGYTSADKLAISGRSNGGLLVGACINQMPELYAVAIIQVGVLDMLRYHKFTGGKLWITEYGCADNEEEFAYLVKYSPLHNVQHSDQKNNKITQYPAVLLTTADHDNRVSPLHSYKFISQLQHCLGGQTSQKRPLLLNVDYKSGHGFGKPTLKVIKEIASIYTFVASNLNLLFQN